MLSINGIEYDNITTTERNALVLPAKGTLIFNVTTNQLEVNTGTAGTPVWTAASGGGGGNTVDETNVKIIATPTYTVLSTDYILWVTANCTITLPAIPTVAIAFPIRIFCRNVKVTVQRTAPDLINGATSFKMKKYDQVTIRAGQANDWGLGD